MIPFGMCKGPPVKQSLVIYFVQTIKNTNMRKMAKVKTRYRGNSRDTQRNFFWKISVRESQHCLEFFIASGLLKISR